MDYLRGSIPQWSPPSCSVTLLVVGLYSLPRFPKNPAYLLWSDILGILEAAGVLSQCSLIFELQPSSFPLDRSKMAYIIKLMSGRVFSCATGVGEQQSVICRHLEYFMAEVRKVLDSSVSGREAAGKHSRSMADYAVDFQVFAAENAWNPGSLFGTFLHGLTDEIKDELAAWELPLDKGGISVTPWSKYFVFIFIYLVRPGCGMGFCMWCVGIVA